MCVVYVWLGYKHITNGRCVDDKMYVNFSSFDNESNSAMCNLLSASKLVFCVAKNGQLTKKWISSWIQFDVHLWHKRCSSGIFLRFTCLLHSISRVFEPILNLDSAFNHLVSGMTHRYSSSEWSILNFMYVRNFMEFRALIKCIYQR